MDSLNELDMSIFNKLKTICISGWKVTERKLETMILHVHDSLLDISRCSKL